MITKIIWHNDRVLGNLGLNLLKDGNPCNTIVLAGENGTGKTRILQTLATFLNRQSFAPFESIEYILGSKKYILTRINDGDAEFGFHKRTCDIDGSSKEIRTNHNNRPTIIESDDEDIRHYGIVYSKARTGFSTKQVKSSSTQELDSDSYQLDDNEDFTPLKQLMVDLSEEDNQEWMEYTKASQSQNKLLDEVYEIFERQSRLNRFKSAFNAFFDSMNFSEVKTMNGEKNVYFTKHNKTITIDQLSTGEKQIVFRGADLLRNKNKISEGTVLVDEPELSMHPKWQEKILKYYRDLFTEGGEQKVQMFFATHSENVLRAALEDKDNVLVVVLKDEGGKITAKPITAPFVLPTITSAELNYEAFDVVSNDYHIALYGYLQTHTSKNAIKGCDDYIVSHSLYDASRHAKTSSSGRDNYQTLPTYIRNVIDHPSPSRTFSQDELRRSIELLRELCEDAKPKP